MTKAHLIIQILCANSVSKSMRLMPRPSVLGLSSRKVYGDWVGMACFILRRGRTLGCIRAVERLCRYQLFSGEKHQIIFQCSQFSLTMVFANFSEIAARSSECETANWTRYNSRWEVRFAWNVPGDASFSLQGMVANVADDFWILEQWYGERNLLEGK
jgi:hypothetical protein